MSKCKNKNNNSNISYIWDKKSSNGDWEQYNRASDDPTIISNNKDKVNVSSVVEKLNIMNFNNKGEVMDPCIPCNASCVDPYYSKDASTRQRMREFRMKSDILKLREITRTKFFLYTNQELAFEEQRKNKNTQMIYENIMEFYNFCYRKLSEMERNAFDEVQEKYIELNELQSMKSLQAEKHRMEMMHQKLNTKFFKAYQRFCYLLKLIEYFDHVSATCEEVGKFNRIVNSPEMIDLFRDLPTKHGPEEANKLINLLELYIRPYLKQNTCTDATIWERGFKVIRSKITDYNQHLTSVALLNHLTEIIHDRFEKTNLKHLTKKRFDKNILFIEERSQNLRERVNDFLIKFEENERKDSTKSLLKGVLTAMIEKLQVEEKPTEISEAKDSNTVDKLEKVQSKLMSLLYQLDVGLADRCYQIERIVRDQIAMQQIQSKEALVQQTRFKNLLDHYRHHYRIKNVSIIKKSTKKILRRSPKVSPTKDDKKSN